jgi:hypothetical protein
LRNRIDPEWLSEILQREKIVGFCLKSGHWGNFSENTEILLKSLEQSFQNQNVYYSWCKLFKLTLSQKGKRHLRTKTERNWTILDRKWIFWSAIPCMRICVGKHYND